MTPCSIVVAVYNHLPYARLFVESLRRHTDPVPDVIFVDNGSTDGTGEYLASLGDVRVIRNGSNLGAAPAWNQGIAAAGGEFVCICHPDVVLPPGWFPRLVGELAAHPAAGAVCAEDQMLIGLAPHHFREELALLGHSDRPPTRAELDAIYPGGVDAFADRFAARHAGLRLVQINSACMVVRKALIEDVGPFDESLGTAFFADLDFFVRAARNRRHERVYVWGGVLVHHWWDLTLRSPSDALLDSAWERLIAKWRGDQPAVGALGRLQSHDILGDHELGHASA